MNSYRLAFAIVAGCCLLRPAPLPADDTAAPFAMEKHYSADLTITTKEGMSIQSKNYVDGDKMRSDASMNGMDMSIIVRKDEQKIYNVMNAQKMVMVMPYDPNKVGGRTAASFGPEGKFTLIGPDTVDGVACMKYSVTSDATKQVFYFWLDMGRKVPLQMSAADNSFSVKWKNFAAGPQDPSLFEPPAGYQMMPMPSMPGTEMPGGAGQ